MPYVAGVAHEIIGVRDNASKLRKIYVMVGCAMCTKMPTGRYLHGAHGAPYCDKTLNLLALGSERNGTKLSYVCIRQNTGNTVLEQD
jgi:hypothetical protein